ncbi:unnamed protein product [Colias eurytheme]|nr:unnamed protein product [Colias eurytheme]
MITVSRRGKPVVVYQQQRYNLSHYGVNGAMYWRCVKRNDGCKSSLKTLNNFLVCVTHDHNHSGLVITKSQRGKPVLLYRNYRYNISSRSYGVTKQWFCYKWIPIFTESRFGKPVILLGKYRYNRYCRSKEPKVQWVCSKWTSGCRASLYTIDNEILDKGGNLHGRTASEKSRRYREKLKHERPEEYAARYKIYLERKNAKRKKIADMTLKEAELQRYKWREAKQAVYTVSRFGRPVIQIGRIRYNLNNQTKGDRAHWLCNKRRSTGCKASVITVNNAIVIANNQHNH